jgi:hypothetical protein
MISHHIYVSVMLAHKESQMEAARQAHQARSLRSLARISRPRRSFLSRIASRGSGHLRNQLPLPRPRRRPERRPEESGSTV